MKTKKILAGVIILAALIPSIFALGANADSSANNTNLQTSIEPINISLTPQYQPEPEYKAVSGTIQQINDVKNTDGNTVQGQKIIRVADKNDENIWDFKLNLNDNERDSTYFISGSAKSMKIGGEIRVFYNSNTIMTMIYPPRINAEFIALSLPEEKSVSIDRFDENFIDSKNQLKLNISDSSDSSDSSDNGGKTEITYEDGKKFEGEIKDLIKRKLVVIYAITTRSIPAQTTPEKIIVMYEKPVILIYKLTQEDKELLAKSLENAEIFVNGKTVKAPGAFISENGVLMIPVRAVAEAMGLKVEWFSDTKTVQVGKSLMFKIGENSYSYNRISPMSLGEASVLKDGRTFVPIDLFSLLGGSYSLDSNSENTVSAVIDIIYDAE